VSGRNLAVNNKRLLQPTLALALIAGFAYAATSCGAEPPVKCTATANPGATRYTLVGTPTGDCSMDPVVQAHGEVVGVQTFVPPVSDPNTYTLPNSVALQPEVASNYVAAGLAVDPPVTPPANEHLYALGAFDDAFPDSAGICHISTPSIADVNMPVVPAHMADDGSGNMVLVDEQPASHIRYEWTNVQIIVNPDSIGTQTFADLKYTRDGCSATFKVSILTPTVFCDTNGMPDQAKCDEPSDPAAGAVPPFTTKCEVQGDQTLCLPNQTQL
jgi:hypothetical protein